MKRATVAMDIAVYSLERDAAFKQLARLRVHRNRVALAPKDANELRGADVAVDVMRERYALAQGVVSAMRAYLESL